MRQKLGLGVLAILAMTLAPAGAAHSAAGRWTIRIDNSGNPGPSTYWGTEDDLDIGICLRGRASCTVVTIPGPWNVSENHDFKVESSAMPFAEVAAIEILATNSDLFVIDQLRLYDETGTLRKTFGADDMKGWCLSTDANDGNNSECSGLGTHLGWGFAVFPIFPFSPTPLD